MSILNPDYNPQIELVDFGSEVHIDAPDFPITSLVKKFRCPKGFATDRDLLLKYSRLAFEDVCTVHYANLTTDGVTLELIYRNKTYGVRICAWNFDNVFGMAQSIFAKTIASDLVPIVPIVPDTTPISKLMYVDIK